MDLKSPALVGFGIFDRNSKQAVNRFFNGVIVGSAFIRALEAGQDDLPGTVRVFMEGL
jgi:tryptophan synthase alpha chain